MATNIRLTKEEIEQINNIRHSTLGIESKARAIEQIATLIVTKIREKNQIVKKDAVRKTIVEYFKLGERDKRLANFIMKPKLLKPNSQSKREKNAKENFGRPNKRYGRRR